jgi:hypothetical protein
MNAAGAANPRAWQEAGLDPDPVRTGSRGRGQAG